MALILTASVLLAWAFLSISSFSPKCPRIHKIYNENESILRTYHFPGSS